MLYHLSLFLHLVYLFEEFLLGIVCLLGLMNHPLREVALSYLCRCLCCYRFIGIITAKFMCSLVNNSSLILHECSRPRSYQCVIE